MKRKRKNIVDSVICYFEEQDIRPENIKFIQDRMSELRICNYLKRQYALTNRPPGTSIYLAGLSQYVKTAET